MSEAVEFTGLKECPVCRKEFTVLWPGQWAYKRGTPSNPVYLCTWKCLRQFDNEKGVKRMGTPRKMTEEQEMEAVRIAIETGDPREYIRSCGIKTPEVKWYDIKNKVKISDPELYAKIPRVCGKKSKPNHTYEEVKKSIMEIPQITVSDAMNNMQDAADEFFGECEKMGLKLDSEPASSIEYKVTGIDTEMGSFRYYKRSGYLDWDFGDNDTVSMNTDEWRQLIEDLPKIMDILGVKL